MQRLHEGDLAGVLNKKPEWHELCLPAIAEKDEAIPVAPDRCYLRRDGCALHPSRMSLATLLERKASSPIVFASQYQQSPIPSIGNIIEAAWLQHYDAKQLDTTHGQIVQSWDTAGKDNPFNDYSACVTALIRGKSIYILDVFRARLQFHMLKAKTIELARLHASSVLLIEDASSGTALVQSLRADEPRGVPLPIARRPEGDKVARVMGASAMVQAGRLFLPNEVYWLADFTGELLGFPLARHDDQVDALSQLLIWVQERDLFRSPVLAGPEEMPSDDEYIASGITGLSDVRFGIEVTDPWGA